MLLQTKNIQSISKYIRNLSLKYVQSNLDNFSGLARCYFGQGSQNHIYKIQIFFSQRLLRQSKATTTFIKELSIKKTFTPFRAANNISLLSDTVPHFNRI